MNVAVIPARHGSKSIVNKNLQKIGPKSLIQRTVLSSQEAGFFDKIILTTDIPVLAEEYKKSKSVLLRERPTHLCGDKSLMQDVIKDIINEYKIDLKSKIWLLQPTAPFRNKEDYEEISSLLKDKLAKSVISVFDVGASHPNRMYTIKDNLLYPLRFTGFANKQDLPRIYQRSGHFYVFYAKDFMEQLRFNVFPCFPYIMSRERGFVNIDDPFDLKLAKLLFGSGVYR